MSRLGRIAISLPKGVKFNISGRTVNVEGPKGKMVHTLPEGISVQVEADKIRIARTAEDRVTRTNHGMTRALLANLVKGVSEGFTKTLVSVGVGYRMQIQGQKLTMSVGFSHPVLFELPKGIAGKVDDQTKLTLSGIDREQLGMIADKIRGIRPPEPYKGKGVRYDGEVIQLKEGKAAGGKGGK